MGIFDGKSNVRELAAKGDVEGLITALMDKDELMGVEAAEALINIGDERAV